MGSTKPNVDQPRTKKIYTNSVATLLKETSYIKD